MLMAICGRTAKFRRRSWIKPTAMVSICAVGMVSNIVLLHLILATDSFRSFTTAEDSPSTLKRIQGEQLAESDTFSACLLIKDDNDLLNEWIAYHYHVLNLRYLIVAVDPSSETSPQSILTQWQSRTDFNVTLWSDPDFMPRDFLVKGYHKDPKTISGDANRSEWHDGHEEPHQVVADTVKILNHRYRQVSFLSACFRHVRKLGKRWTMHIDTDEFVVVNPLLRTTTRRHVLRIPPIREQSSVFTVIQQVYKDKQLNKKANFPCVSMPRLLFGSIERQNNNNAEDAISIPSWLNASKLETTRWLYHTAYDDKERNARPKVIVDVGAVKEDDQMFGNSPFSIHRPSQRLCRRLDRLKLTELFRFPIAVNYYVGSWERYSAKNDTRRSRRVFDRKAHVQDHYDSSITGWLQGFVETHDFAREMLKLYHVED